MVYHGILWESMGNFSILLTVRVLFCKNMCSILPTLCRLSKIKNKKIGDIFYVKSNNIIVLLKRNFVVY